MPVLRLIRERFERERPLDGLRIGACLHVTTETANLMRTLKAGGAEVVLCGLEPALDQGRRRRGARHRVRDPDVRAARRGPRHVLRAPQRRRRHAPASDDGRRLRPRVAAPHGAPRAGHARSSPAPRRRRPASSGSRRWPPTAPSAIPVIAVNEAQTKHLFDNRYGTGQSTVDGLLRATNLLIAGRNVAIAGYGWVGRGIASRMDGHGRARGGDRGRPGARPRGADGRLPGDDRGPGRAVGRPVRHRDRQHQRLPARALRGDEATAR